MIFKKSITNIFRSKGKSALFFTLILSLTIVLSLGLSVWVSISSFLDEIDQNYKTVGLFEYMGPEYPDVDYYDEGLQHTVNNFNYSLVENNENVILFDTTKRALGHVDGFVRTDNLIPRKNYSIFVVGNLQDSSRYVYLKSNIYDYLYTYEDTFNQSIYIYPIIYDMTKNDLERYYLIHGSSMPGFRRSVNFFVTPFYNDAAEQAGFVPSVEDCVLDITTEDGEYEIPEGSFFGKIAQTYNFINNSVDVYAVQDLNSLYVFHQQEVYITAGREFTSEEYSTQQNVCVVSELFAKKMDVTVGDKIPLQVVVTENASYYGSYWADTGHTYEDEFTIVGITNAHIEFNNNIYIPKRDDWDFSPNHIGYTIGQVILDNNGADQFYNEMLPLLPDRVRLTIYDQGYSALAKPFQDILRIAKIATIICLIVCLAVIIFFGYLFVYRQRDVSDTMIKLGAGKIKACNYFLYSTGFIAVIAAGIGSLIASSLSGFVMTFVSNAASNYETSDVRFSNSNLTIIKETVFDAEISNSFFIYTGLAVVMGALICALAFTISTFKKKRAKKVRKIKKIKSGHTFKSGGRSFKFSALSILRGGIRTLVVPLLSITVILFFWQLAQTSQNYHDELNSIKQDTVITGHYTDIKGQKADNILAESYQVKDLIQSGYLSEVNISNAIVFGYLGLYDPSAEDVPFVMPEGFALETLLTELRFGPILIFTNNLSAAPEFFFTSNIVIDYLDGYDESILSQEVDEVPCCFVTNEYMEERGLKLGDQIEVFLPSIIVDGNPLTQNLMIVGSYERQGTRDNIYCQLDYHLPLDMLYNYDSDDNSPFFGFVFDSVSFTLKDATKLDDFKTFMSEYGFSGSNNINTYRNFIVLNDKKFISTVDMLNRQINYINVLYPVLYALVGVISLVVSYLLAVSRRKEFAIMRGLGAQKHITFFSFFIEQILLCIIGAAIGVAISMLMYTGFSSMQLILTAGYILCYMIGCVISITIMNNTTVLAILKYED